jgi:hypothetical protein
MRQFLVAAVALLAAPSWTNADKVYPGFARMKKMTSTTSSASKEAVLHSATISAAIRKRSPAITSALIVLSSETMYRFARRTACTHFRSRLWSRSELEQAHESSQYPVAVAASTAPIMRPLEAGRRAWDSTRRT